MTESRINFDMSPENRAIELITRTKQVLDAATEIVNSQPFQEPSQSESGLRADDQGLQLAAEQEVELRRVAAELGIGREEDLFPSELGLERGNMVIEGGQSHKIKAELELVQSDPEANPTSIIFTASSGRKIGDPEREVTAKVLGFDDVAQVGETEYDVALQVATNAKGFRAEPDEPTVMPFSYDIHRGFGVGDDKSGQLIRIGSIGVGDRNVPTYMFRIDREDYVEEVDGVPKNKYRNQPDAFFVLGILNRMFTNFDRPFVHVTSGTYQHSRLVDSLRFAIQFKREAGVASYGTVRLASVKGDESPTPPAINQIPGELKRGYDQAKKLGMLVNKIF